MKIRNIQDGPRQLYRRSATRSTAPAVGVERAEVDVAWNQPVFTVPGQLFQRAPKGPTRRRMAENEPPRKQLNNFYFFPGAVKMHSDILSVQEK